MVRLWREQPFPESSFMAELTLAYGWRDWFQRCSMHLRFSTVTVLPVKQQLVTAKSASAPGVWLRGFSAEACT